MHTLDLIENNNKNVPINWNKINIDNFLKKKQEKLCIINILLKKIHKYEPSLIELIQDILHRLILEDTIFKLDYIQINLNNQRLFHNKPHRGLISLFNFLPSKLTLNIPLFYKQLIKLIKKDYQFNCIINSYFIKVSKIVSQKNLYPLNNNSFFTSLGCHWYKFKFATLTGNYILIINEIIGYCYFIKMKNYTYDIFSIIKKIHPNLEHYYCDKGEYIFNTLTENENKVLNKIKEHTNYFYGLNR